MSKRNKLNYIVVKPLDDLPVDTLILPCPFESDFCYFIFRPDFVYKHKDLRIEDYFASVKTISSKESQKRILKFMLESSKQMDANLVQPQAGLERAISEISFGSFTHCCAAVHKDKPMKIAARMLEEDSDQLSLPSLHSRSLNVQPSSNSFHEVAKNAPHPSRSVDTQIILVTEGGYLVNPPISTPNNIGNSLCRPQFHVTILEGIAEFQSCYNTPLYLNPFKGDNGIQGGLNSCFLDSSLFAMFAMNASFDGLIYNSQIPIVIQLREDIVNPLRRNKLVPEIHVTKFRESCELIGMTGMTKDERDPEEFLTAFFDKSNAPKYLKYKDGDSEYMLTLLFESQHGTNRHGTFAVRDMLQHTFQHRSCKLKQLPSNLIMQIPHQNEQYVGFDKVQMDLELDLGPHLSNECLGNCQVCRDRGCAVFYCDNCLVVMCAKCNRRVHNCSGHVCPLYRMQLYAVLSCTERHYVTYVRVKTLESYRWFHFNSMRQICHGNIWKPIVQELPDTEQWIHALNDSITTDHLKAPRHSHDVCLLTKAYTLFYRCEMINIYK